LHRLQQSGEPQSSLTAKDRSNRYAKCGFDRESQVDATGNAVIDGRGARTTGLIAQKSRLAAHRSCSAQQMGESQILRAARRSALNRPDHVTPCWLSLLLRVAIWHEA
jgi:hypothetical protein